MKSVWIKVQILLANLALIAGVMVANGRCCAEYYQPEVPHELKK